MNISKSILPIIVFSQFCCTSLWFVGNAVIGDLIRDFGLGTEVVGTLTSVVQFGFIIGTLVFAIFTITDRFSPSKIFLFCGASGALINLTIVFNGNTFTSLIAIRFLTGFFLAGIYPVGMKIAADYYDKGLGKSLGYLVGALVLGTAFPHLLKDVTSTLPWKSVIISTSTLAIIGGLMMKFFVGDGPYRKKGLEVNFTCFFSVFKNAKFRSAAFGYFGHMWELYSFWAFVPAILASFYGLKEDGMMFSISLASFAIIGAGSVACVIGGYLSQNLGIKKTAMMALLSSCLCCLALPLMISGVGEIPFLLFMIFWGMVVIMDSPLFSTMVANNAKAEIKGTALTIVNCIGFSITIISIQLISWLFHTCHSNNYIFMLLALGPVLGLFFLSRAEE